MLLYELSTLEAQILEQLESEDGIDKKLYDELKLNEEEKLVSCARVYRQILSDAQACKEEEKRLAERKKKLENNAQRLKDLIMEGMKLTQINKIRRPEFDISIKKNPPSLRIDTEVDIPSAFYEEVPPVLNKTALKTAIKNGLDIPGVALIQTERIEIK